MDTNGRLYTTIAVIIGAIMMSFAWPIRGQFGHEWGALITGAFAAIAGLLVQSPSFRQVFPKSVFFGAIGFVIGGENIPYGQLINGILVEPDLKSALPGLLTVLFIGATWGCVGGTYLGYGLAEVPVTRKDYRLIVGMGVVALVVSAIINTNAAIAAAFVLLILGLQFYNFKVTRSRFVPLLGFACLVSFGLGFFIAVVILYLGTNGQIGGPGGWWTLRDQMWGGLGGLGLTWVLFRGYRLGLKPLAQLDPSLARLGLVFFIPFICGWNTYDVYEKWFQSSPPAPDLRLAGAFIAAGVLMLAAWAVYYVRMPADNLSPPKLNALLLASTAFFSVYLMVLAIAKTVIYSGWSRWETGFTLFLFAATVILLTMPFVLLGLRAGTSR